MKYRGIVTNVTDPESVGRIKAKLIGYDDTLSETPWAFPCSVLAGPGYGFYCLPQVGDEVWMEKTYGGEWVFSGFVWSKRKPIPTDGSATVRVFRTPVGHQLKIDENGDIEIKHHNGSVAVLKANGDVEIQAEKNILLNDNGTVRAVNTMSICSFTGLPHPQGSKTVFVEKP